MKCRCITALLVAFSALTGCDAGGGYNLVVDLRTDLRAAYDFSTVRLTIDEAPDSALVGERRTAAAALGDDFVRGQRVAELREMPAGPYLLTLEMLDSSSSIVATRRLRVQLMRTRTLTVLVTSDCFAVSCPSLSDAPDATECVSGRCVPPECVSDDPTLCGEPACEVDGDCAASVSCVVGQCVEGECFRSPDDDLCEADRYCDVNDGCLDVPDFPDAGPAPDAGPSFDGGATADSGPDSGSTCRPSDCNDGDPCTNDACGASGTCTNTPRCGSGEYCVSGSCYPNPVLRLESSEAPGCADLGVDHGSSFLWRRTVTGRPGATFQQFNQHAGCGDSFAPALEGTLNGSGSYQDEDAAAAVTDCDFPVSGRYRAYVEVDGIRSDTVELTYYNSRCSSHNTCSEGRSYCPPCRDCDASTEYCYASSSCAPNPTFQIETMEGAGCADLALTHTDPDFLWRRTVTGRSGATAQQFNEKVSCGTAPMAAEALPLVGGRNVSSGGNTATADCANTLYGRYRSWAEVDGERSDTVEVTYFNSNCPGFNSCAAARTYCP